MGLIKNFVNKFKKDDRDIIEKYRDGDLSYEEVEDMLMKGFISVAQPFWMYTHDIKLKVDEHNSEIESDRKTIANILKKEYGSDEERAMKWTLKMSKNDYQKILDSYILRNQIFIEAGGFAGLICIWYNA